MAEEVQQRSEAFWAGRAAVFETPDGGAVVAYRADGEQADSHHPIPAAVWQIMASLMRGEAIDLNPLSIVKLLMGR